MPIRTFAEACKNLKLNPMKILPDVKSYPKKHHKALIAKAKLIIIIEALNEGWEPDWNNYQEYKYFPWFFMDEPGFRFHVSYDWYPISNHGGGTRLCFKTRELSDYAGKKFISLYKDFMVVDRRNKK